MAGENTLLVRFFTVAETAGCLAEISYIHVIHAFLVINPFTYTIDMRTNKMAIIERIHCDDIACRKNNHILGIRKGDNLITEDEITCTDQVINTYVEGYCQYNGGY